MKLPPRHRFPLYAMMAALLLPSFALETARGQVPAIPTVDRDFSRIQNAIATLEPSEDTHLPTYAPAAEGDDDLGVQMLMREAERYRAWRISASAALYWTDNASLTDLVELEDTYLNAFATVNFLPRINGNLYGEFFANYQIYRYQENGRLDFDDLEAGAGLVNVFRNRGDLSIFGRYNYERILEATDYTEIFVNHSFLLGAYRPFTLGQRQFAYLRMAADLSLGTAPNLLRRHEYSALAGYRYTPIDKLAVNVYYRVRLLDYRKLGGTDWNHQLGGGISYQFLKNFRFGINGYWTMNDSSRRFGDYSAANLGGLAGFSIKL
ncbi:MAG: hypothetical protein ACC661_00665 [Verrucomicrobiales bacterium]